MKALPSQQLAMIFGVNRFHNSTMERDERRLGVYEEAAKKQDKTILEWMRVNVRPQGWTSSEISVHFPQMFRESLKRALTNNSKDPYNEGGYLVDTGERREGDRNRPCKVWQYRNQSSLNK